MPEPYVKIHPIIDPNDLVRRDYVDITNPEVFAILSHKAHYYVKKLQLEHEIKQRQYNIEHPSEQKPIEPLRQVFLTPEKHPQLSYPIFIGKNGEVIAVYQKEKLGEGGFGVVYLGVNLDTRESHAIKIQRPKRGQMAQIKEEEKVLEDVGRSIDRIEKNIEGQFISAQRLVWGVNLKKYLEQNPDPMKKILVAINVIKAVEQALAQGYLHRDIKLENMMVDEEGSVQLVDFGSAKKMDSKGVATGDATTVHCTAPEVFNDQLEDNPCIFSEKTEMFAVGVTLAELFSRHQLAFPQKDIMRHIQSMSEKGSGVPSIFVEMAPDIFRETPADSLQTQWFDCIKRMVDIDPNKRPHFADCRAELEAIYSQIRTQQDRSPPSVISAAAAAAATMPPESASSPFSSSPLSSSPQSTLSSDSMQDLAKLAAMLDPEVVQQLDILVSSVSDEGTHDASQIDSSLTDLHPPVMPPAVVDAGTRLATESALRQMLTLIGTSLKDVIEPAKIKRGLHFHRHSTDTTFLQPILQNINEILKKPTMQVNEVIAVLYAIISVRGQCYAKGKSPIPEKVDEVLKRAQAQLTQELEKTPEYQAVASQRYTLSRGDL